MSHYLMSVLTSVTIFGIYGLGLNVQWGWSGVLNLAFITFAALGAYATSVLTMGGPPPGGIEHYIIGAHLPFIVALPIAAVVVAVVGLVVGAVALRQLRDDYFAIVTVAFGTIVFTILSQQTGLFNGQVGLFNIPAPFAGALNLSYDGYSYFFFGMCLVALAGIYVILELLFKSPFGRALVAVREDESSAQAFGRNAYGMKLRAFAIGAAVASVGGALQAAYLQTYNPSAWDSSENFILYAAIFIGGSANSRGVLLGIAVIAGVFQEATRYLPTIPSNPSSADAIRQILIGVLIVLALRWRPQGLIPERRTVDRLAQDRRGWWLRKRVVL